MQLLSAFHHLPPFISLVSVHDLPLHYAPPLLSISNTASFRCPCCPCLPFIFYFSHPPITCFTLLLHFSLLWPSILGLPRLWLRWERPNQETVMRRWVPVEVFIEMGLYRDWSCLRFPCTKTAIQSLFPLSGDPLSWIQCILFHSGLVILQRRAIIGICQRAVCVCVCVWLKSETEWEILVQKVPLTFDIQLFFVCLNCFSFYPSFSNTSTTCMVIRSLVFPSPSCFLVMLPRFQISAM